MNYHIYFDNYFLSIDLMSSLPEDGILACETVRKGRKDLPKLPKRDKYMNTEDSDYRTSDDSIRWIKWFDKKPVQFVSNFHESLPCQRCGDGTKMVLGKL